MHIERNLLRAEAVDSAVQSVAVQSPTALSPGGNALPGRRGPLSLAMHPSQPPLSLCRQWGQELQQSLKRVQAAHKEVLTLPGWRCAALAASHPGLGLHGPRQAPSTWVHTGVRKQPGEVLQMKHFVAKKQI